MSECVYAHVFVWVCMCTYIVCECVYAHVQVYCVWMREDLCTQLCACVLCTGCGHRFLAACLSALSCILQQRTQGCTKKAERLPFVSCLSSAGPTGRRGEGVPARVPHAKAAPKIEEGLAVSGWRQPRASTALPITGTSRAAHGKGIGCHEEDIPPEHSRSPQKEPPAYYTHFST